MSLSWIATPWIAAIVAAFLWWFATGAILMAVRYAERGGARGRMICTLFGLPLFGLGLWGYVSTLSASDTLAVYGAFLSAIAIWGWVELSFLTGAITGPNPHACPRHTPEWERFLRAWGTVAYHEMLLTMTLVLLWLWGMGAENTVGLWTFTVLYVARISAKLNLYCGVPRINLEFIPDALRHLPSHFRISRFNWLFPFSITTLTFATAFWLERMIHAGSPSEAAGYTLLAALTALALLEHWLMVVPLPDAKLWRWMLPAPKQAPTPNQATREGTNGL
ncbi:MAG: putative photosynthetic complex assembly protein PuhE [Pseudomonadota bacterium]